MNAVAASMQRSAATGSNVRSVTPGRTSCTSLSRTFSAITTRSPMSRTTLATSRSYLPISFTVVVPVPSTSSACIEASQYMSAGWA
jgi:hypothetical protein